MTAVNTLVTRLILETGEFSNTSGKALGVLAGLTGALAGLATAGVAAGVGLMRQAAEFDSLRQSIISIEGDAKKAQKALADLKELARAPGLGYDEAVRGYTGLRNAGLTQQFAERLIREFANANARGGGNAETFGRVLTQIKQAAIKPYLAQEDLRPIGEAGIPINSLLKKLYGTGDTEQLKSQGITADRALHDLVEELAKLPRVAGGAQNEFDNLADALRFAGDQAGEALNEGLLSYATKFADGVTELSDDGVIKSAFQGIADNIVSILGGASDDVTDSLIPLIAATETVSGGFRNLIENLKGLAEWSKEINKYNPIAWVGNAIKNKLFGQEGTNDDISLGGEYQRNISALMAQRDAYRKSRKPKDPLAADQPEEAKSEDQKAIPLLQRIATATEKQIDLNRQALGGGELARNAVSAKNVRGVTGGGAAYHLRQAASALDNSLEGLVRMGNDRLRQQGM